MLPFIEMNFWVTVTLDHILEALWNYFGNYGHLNRAAKYLSLSYNYSPEKYVSGSPQNRLIPKDDFERHWIKYLRKDTSSKVILFLYKNWERTEKQTQFSGFGVRFRNRINGILKDDFLILIVKDLLIIMEYFTCVLNFPDFYCEKLNLFFY